MKQLQPSRRTILAVLTEEGLGSTQAGRIADELMRKINREHDDISMPLEEPLDSARNDDSKSMVVLGAAVKLAVRQQISELDSVRGLRNRIIAFLQWKEKSSRIPPKVQETGIALNPFTPLLTPTRFVQQLVAMLPDAKNKGKTRIRYYDPAIQATFVLEWPDHEITDLLVQAIEDACAFGPSREHAATLVLTNWMHDVPLIDATYRKPKKGTSIGYFHLTFADCLPVKEVQQAIEVLRYRPRKRSKASETRKVEREKIPSLERLSLFVQSEIELNPDVVARQRFKEEPKAKAKSSRDRAAIRETRDWFVAYLGSSRQSDTTEYLTMKRRVKPEAWVGTLSMQERELIVDARLRMFAESQTYEDVTELALRNMRDDLLWSRQVALSLTLAAELPAKVDVLQKKIEADHVDKYLISVATADKYIDLMLELADERARYCYAASVDDLGTEEVTEWQEESDDGDVQYEKELAREQKRMLRRWEKPYDDKVFNAFSCTCRRLYIRYHLASVVSHYAQDELDELAIALAKMVVHDECNCRGRFILKNGHMELASQPYLCSVASWPERELPTRYGV